MIFRTEQKNRVNFSKLF